MRVGKTLIALAMVPMLMVGCAGESASTTTTPSSVEAPPAEDQGAVLVEVSGVKVYSKEFEMAASRKTPANGETLTAEERKEVLQKLIEEKALYLEAKSKGVDQDPKVQKVMVNTLLRQEVYSGVRNQDINDDELKKYFDEHQSEFVVPEKAQIKRILIKVSDKQPDAAAKKLADDVRAQVKATPEKFADLAAQHSEDPYKRRGGDLGFIAKEGKPGIEQAVVDMAFSLKVGEVSDVFKSADGYNVVLLANKREGVERTFEQMRSSVLRRVKNDKYRELYDTYVAEIGKKYPASSIDEAALMAIEVSPSRKAGPGGLGGPGAPGAPGAPEGDEGMIHEGAATAEGEPVPPPAPK